MKTLSIGSNLDLKGPTRRALYGISPTAYPILRLLFLLVPLVHALPLSVGVFDIESPLSAHNPQLWIYLGIAIGLVLGGGAFAGLTIALMGQDEIYLQVLAESGDATERSHAAKVLKLLKRGKHWVLVTLLLSNVITNETLPIVLDRSLGGGWPAVLGSTVLIVIFGEIAPQSVCVRYGLPIGAYLTPFVLALMYIMAPIAWPTARLLDWLLGEDHGTTYKKGGLKSLVRLHQTIGESPADRLEDDEVTIISAVLDLKEKPIGDIMTPMENVLTMAADEILDETKMGEIVKAGYSRIPVHEPGNKQNFLGMLLVKMLLSYDPEDAKPVRDFALATLPETKPETSCLNMINFFQEGKSHMVLVSENPGENSGILGVVTLEDVIEELIGEEIVDESDVYVDMQQMDRRTNQVEWARAKAVDEQERKTETNGKLVDVGDDTESAGDDESRRPSIAERLMSDAANATGPEHGAHSVHRSQLNTLLRRRSGSGTDLSGKKLNKHALTPAQKAQRKLGPSNLASAPKSTKFHDFKIKPGGPSGSTAGPKATDNMDSSKVPETVIESQDPVKFPTSFISEGIGAGLLENAGRDAKDGAHAVTHHGNLSPEIISQNKGKQAQSTSRGRVYGTDGADSEDADSLGSLDSKSSQGISSKRHVRSGSIAEKRVSVGGVNKVVLETTSSSEENHDTGARANPGKENKKVSRRGSRKRGKKGAKGSDDKTDETSALLSGR